MMKKIKKVRWDPIIAKLADNKLKQKIYTDASNHDMTSTSKVNGVIISQKRRSKEVFQTFLHTLFDNDGPKVKYQNPDAWRVYPFKKKTDDR
ncbi:hypothetical protein ES703_89058 [subsurface metagenome]|jgi:hypothetical protein